MKTPRRFVGGGRPEFATTGMIGRRGFVGAVRPRGLGGEVALVQGVANFGDHVELAALERAVLVDEPLERRGHRLGGVGDGAVPLAHDRLKASTRSRFLNRVSSGETSKHGPDLMPKSQTVFQVIEPATGLPKMLPKKKI